MEGRHQGRAFKWVPLKVSGGPLLKLDSGTGGSLVDPGGLFGCSEADSVDSRGPGDFLPGRSGGESGGAVGHPR